VSEIEFVGSQGSHKTDEFAKGSTFEWHDYKLEANETVIGVYGSTWTYFAGHKMVSMGFILSNEDKY
jgi:hypothetical protein